MFVCGTVLLTRTWLNDLYCVEWGVKLYSNSKAKDLTLKAKHLTLKPKAKDLTHKAKTKDLTLKAKDLTSEQVEGPL